MSRTQRLAIPSETAPQWDGVHGVSASEIASADVTRRAAKEAFRSGRAPQAPGLSLDTGTLNYQGPGWRVTLLDFGRGVVEASCVFQEGGRPRVKSPRAEGRACECFSDPSCELCSGSGWIGSLASKADSELRVQERKYRAIRRAKQSMKRRCYALAPDRMLTLTKRGKFPDIDAAWAAWSRFERICSRFWREWKYVVVPERHADGTYHLHVALRGFYHVGMLRGFWFRALGGNGREKGDQTPGNVDMSPPRAGSRSGVRIASYLRKYMAKDIGACVSGRRSFAASRGLVPVRVARWRESIHLGLAAPLVVTRRIRALVGNIALDWFEWKEAGLQGFTVKTFGS